MNQFEFVIDLLNETNTNNPDINDTLIIVKSLGFRDFEHFIRYFSYIAEGVLPLEMTPDKDTIDRLIIVSIFNRLSQTSGTMKFRGKYEQLAASLVCINDILESNCPLLVDSFQNKCLFHGYTFTDTAIIPDMEYFECIVDTHKKMHLIDKNARFIVDHFGGTLLK